MMDDVDQDAVIRTLFARFGDRRFQVSDLSVDQLAWVVDPHGTKVARRRRSRPLRPVLERLLNLILGKMDGYRCATEPNLGATLTVVEAAEGSREAVYQIQHPQ